MKARELIKRLREFPGDTEVLVYATGDNGGFYDTADDVWGERNCEDNDGFCCIGPYEH